VNIIRFSFKQSSKRS